jgi:hypothetical protein
MERMNSSYKRIRIFGLIIFFFLCLAPETLKAERTLHTRTISVSDAINKKDVLKSPLFRAFQGLKPENVIRTYEKGAARGDTWLRDEGKPYSSFKQFFVRILYWFTMLKEGPDSAMSVLAPFFLFFFLISVLPFGFKALFVPPDMENPRRPENDKIKRRWFRRKRTSQSDEELSDDEFDDEDQDDDEAADDMDEEECDEEDRS